MQNHILQAQRNLLKLFRSERDFPAGDYEWKTTYIFYVAVHWTRAFIKVRIGSHINITSHVNAKAYLQRILPQRVFSDYVHLEKISKTARYNGVGPNFQGWQLDRQIDYEEAKDILEVLRTTIAMDIPQVLNNATFP
ncbi:MAG TPA: hypothetical protein VF646_15710 [Cytophagales bacterium]